MNGTDAHDASRPGTRSFAIAPSDDDDLPVGTRWLYVGGGGDVKVSLVDDNSSHTGTVLTDVPDGSVLRIAVRRVWATGTTATDLVGFA